VTGADRRDQMFSLLPTVDDLLQSPPVEQVWLLRDEGANQAWAVEATATGPSGDRVDRDSAYDRALSAEPAPAGAVSGSADPTIPLRYLLRTAVPDHWYPLVRISEDNVFTKLATDVANVESAFSVASLDLSATLWVPRTPSGLVGALS